MVSVYPFRGLRYNLPLLEGQGTDLSRVTAPPYDVIGPELQARLYRQHPANIVRAILNRPTERDTDTHNRYSRAASFIFNWETHQVLIPEPEPAIYAYSQTWDGITRQGAIVLLRLEQLEAGPGESNSVLPHERTLKGPKVDRLQLMHASLCNLSQIFMIYADPDRTLEQVLFAGEGATGWAEATDEAGVMHRFKPVYDSGIHQEIQALFKDKPLLIADGHHRYETALAFQAEMREWFRRENGHEAWPGALLSDYVMVFVTNMDDPGLKVYPTHRVLTGWPEGWDRGRFERALFERYEIVSSPDTATFAYQTQDRPQPIYLKIKPEAQPSGLHPLLADYDAALLEETVFKGILGQTGEQMKQAHVLDFIREEAAVEDALRGGTAPAVFWLQAPSVKDVLAVCQAGERMPQKSTYFYPKILSGLVLYPYRPFLDHSGHALSGVLEAQPFAEKACQTAAP